MHGAGDIRSFDRFAPVYDLMMPPADPGALGMALDRTDRDVERVVDIGDSSGRATLALDAPERIILDRSVGIFRRTCRRGLGCIRDDARKLSFADGSFNAVTIVDAFHHMPNQCGVAEGVFRVLAPNGIFAVNEFGPEALLSRGLAVAERIAGFGSAFATSDELVRFPERVGFEAAVAERDLEYTVVGKERESH